MTLLAFVRFWFQAMCNFFSHFRSVLVSGNVQFFSHFRSVLVSGNVQFFFTLSFGSGFRQCAIFFTFSFGSGFRQCAIFFKLFPFRMLNGSTACLPVCFFVRKYVFKASIPLFDSGVAICNKSKYSSFGSCSCCCCCRRRRCCQCCCCMEVVICIYV